MAKTFACGDVVPGCAKKLTGSDEKDLMEQVAKHAKEAHGMASVPSDVAEKVKSKIKDA